MSEIYLHIGLHKTATKYFQHHLFPFLSKDKFLYNPEKLTQYAMDYLKAEETHEKEQIISAFKIEKEHLLKMNKTIIISREIMSGNLFGAYNDWETSKKDLHTLFPEAKLIISFRFQVDWLVSCYRESVHEHHYQKIEDFLCYSCDTKEFYKPESDKNKNGYANLYALNLDYARMLNTLFSLYGKEKVFILFYENFKKDKDKTIERVLKFIGSPHVTPKPLTGIPNRGYSALSIMMSIERASLLKEKGLEQYVHRPIFFFGPKSIPAGNIDVSLLNKEKYWGSYFLKDNEEVRSPSYPNLNQEERENLEKSWRYVVKNDLDRKEYIDWDLLGDLRKPLEDYYHELNKLLVNYIDANEIPDKYFNN